MLSADELKQISDILDKKLDPIKNDIGEIKADIEVMKTDIDVMKTDIDDLKKHTEVTRYAANLAVEWIDTYFRDEFPLKDIINKQLK